MNDSVENAKRLLADYIEHNKDVWYYNTTKTELRIRCPYCGDSVKNDKHAHLYIQMNNADCIKYYCQRCNIGGIVNQDFLKDISISNFELSDKINEINKEYSRSRKVKSNSKSVITRNNLIFPNFNNKFKSIAKYDYVCSRYSFDLTPDEYISNYKFIFSLKDFLVANEIVPTSLSKEDLQLLNDQFVGIVSADNSYIIFRNIDKTSKLRYFNFNIFDDIEAKKFYIPRGNIDLFTLKPTLVITEGIFDLIGVKEYFYKNAKDTIFCAVNGKAYNFVINMIAKLGFISMNIKIYSDKDVKLSYYKYLKKNNIILKNNEVEIFYNTKSKDYGIPLEDIELISSTI